MSEIGYVLYDVKTSKYFTEYEDSETILKAEIFLSRHDVKCAQRTFPDQYKIKQIIIK